MPGSALLPALFFGLLLGVKHALDADHVVAVTAIVSRTNSLLRSMLVGMNWGIRHTLTLFTVGLGVLVFKLTIPTKMALSMEFVVGFILVLLGVPIIKQLSVNRAHIHLHQHSDEYHLHTHSHCESSSHSHQHTKRPLLVGMVHGFAARRRRPHPTCPQHDVLSGTRTFLSSDLRPRLHHRHDGLDRFNQSALQICDPALTKAESVDSGNSRDGQYNLRPVDHVANRDCWQPIFLDNLIFHPKTTHNNS